MTTPTRQARLFWLAGLAIFAAVAGLELAMGREPICRCGSIRLWHGQVMSAENSQHIADWYTPSHIVHGLLFYLAGWLLLRRWPLAARALVALLLEACWEVAENTDAVIRHYREATISLDYFGDSVVNSLSDMGAMLLGFLLASRLPVWAAVVLGLGLEVLAAAVIRDNLALNVLMLLHPVAWVKAWQAGA